MCIKALAYKFNETFIRTFNFISQPVNHSTEELTFSLMHAMLVSCLVNRHFWFTYFWPTVRKSNEILKKLPADQSRKLCMREDGDQARFWSCVCLRAVVGEPVHDSWWRRRWRWRKQQCRTVSWLSWVNDWTVHVETSHPWFISISGKRKRAVKWLASVDDSWRETCNFLHNYSITDTVVVGFRTQSTRSLSFGFHEKCAHHMCTVV